MDRWFVILHAQGRRSREGEGDRQIDGDLGREGKVSVEIGSVRGVMDGVG